MSSLGGAKFGALSQALPLVLTLFSLQACDGGDFEKLVRFQYRAVLREIN